VISTFFPIFSVFLLLLLPLIPLSVQASAGPDSYFYPADSKPFGKSYPEWAAIWFKFVFEYPVKDARLSDPDGSLCAVNQTGSVWILPGASNGEFTRRCVIPNGTSLLISPTDGYCNKRESNVGDNEAEIRKCVKDDVDEDTYSYTILDGVKISNLHDVNRFQSVLFDLNYPPNEGPYKTVTDGVFLMLKPLPRGNHTLVQAAGATQPGESADQGWNYKVTYYLEVK